MAAYRRSVFLINKRFQLRFSFYVCSWLFALSLIYPLIIYNLFDFFLQSATVDPHGPELAKINDIRGEMIRMLALLQVLFLSVTFMVSIFVSHRIAGPLYKLQQFFKAATQGDLKSSLSFRKADHFQELALSYNEMMDEVRHKFSEAESHIQKALAGGPESQQEMQKALEAIREIRQNP